MYDDLDMFDPRDAVATRSLLWQRVLAVFVAVGVFAAAGSLVARSAFTGPTAAAPAASVTAAGSGIVVITPGAKPQRIAHVQPIAGGQSEDSVSKAAYRYPHDGSIVDAGQLWTSATVRANTVTSRSRADVGTVSLLGGRIELRNVSLSAHAAVAKGRASGSFELRPGSRLVVDGAEQELRANHVVTLPGVATVTLDEQAVVALAPKGDEQTGPRARVVGAVAHVRLTAPAGGLPAGSEIVVGRVEAGVRQGKITAVQHPGVGAVQAPATPSGLVTTPGSPSLQPGVPKPGESTLPRQGTTVRASGAAPAGPLNGYLFPVLGQANYSNDWGAPRASTGMGHQGTDVFAPQGTPIVAIADGVLDRVGWNSIGGYRFWLFDQHGNAFYHAHLSAFSPLAQDGARVRAGDVIGFVGTTGDAQGTPPHLHFEIHPNNGAPVNPFTYLNAWKRGIATAIGSLGAGGTAGGLAPLTLLDAADIAPNSGLEHSVLDHVTSGARPVSEETKPKPTDDTLEAAIGGSGISAE